MNVTELLERGLRRHGLMGGMRRALLLTRQAAERLPYMHERHVWYRLDLKAQRPHIDLPAGIELKRADVADLGLLEQLETIGFVEARRRLAMGAELWIAHESGQAAFSCWIFYDRAPVLAAPGGWLALPEGTACLEDSVTSARYRGRGIAPAVWSCVADALRQEGVTALITKVEESNTPCRRAIAKVGGQQVAEMDFERIWLRPHVQVSPNGEYRYAAFLVERLSR